MADNELLVITAEECGELVQTCCKILRWGPEKGNVEKLMEEAGDVQCMINLLIEKKLFTKQDIDARIKVKRDKLKIYSKLIDE